MSSPKLPRATTDEERAELKSATRHSLRQVKANRFAMVTRVDEARISKFGSISEPDSFMPADVILDLQHEYGPGVASPLLTALAALAGFRLVPIEAAIDGEPLTVGDVSTLIKEGGEAKAAALAATDTTCLHTVRAARKEIGDAALVYSMVDGKLARHERRLAGGAA
jgi:hypothetical protein